MPNKTTIEAASKGVSGGGKDLPRSRMKDSACLQPLVRTPFPRNKTSHNVKQNVPQRQHVIPKQRQRIKYPPMKDYSS